MKRIAIAAAALCAATASANTPADVPGPKCEPKPTLPGATLMQDNTVRKRFERDFNQYKECMNAYLEARKAAIKANETAANAAIDEYNGVVKALEQARKAQKGE